MTWLFFCGSEYKSWSMLSPCYVSVCHVSYSYPFSSKVLNEINPPIFVSASTNLKNFSGLIFIHNFKMWVINLQFTWYSSLKYLVSHTSLHQPYCMIPKLCFRLWYLKLSQNSFWLFSLFTCALNVFPY